MRPRQRPAIETFGEAWERLFDPPAAHRGLWSPGGAPENSLAAFAAAVAAGYGVELDVHLSADGEAVVFHDDRLERMTGVEGRLRDRRADELAQLRLNGSDEHIPTLAEALTVIGHRTMVFIELKTPFGEVGPLEKRVSEVLLDHNGPSAVIGFNPYSHAWFAEHRPQILRGLNSYAWDKDVSAHIAPEQRRAFANLEHVELAQPDFLALDIKMLPSPRAAVLRDKGMPIIGWTARSAEQRDQIADYCDNGIFEGFKA